MKSFLKVGISGVRGIVGESFTPQLAMSFARAFGSFVGRGSVVIGRDTRPTGLMIEYAVVAGLQSVGCKPLLAGIVPTPTLLRLTAEHSALGAIGITASHNAAEWNALKFVDRTGLFLGRSRAEELFDIFHQGDFRVVPEHEIPEATRIADPTRGHFERVFQYVDTAAIRALRLKVAVDCCNGVGALHTRGFLEKLGCEVVTCFDAPNGLFEREPEPLPENLVTLGQLVRDHGCAIGFAQDPDGDRLAIVDATGRPIGEDMTLAFAVQQVLERHEKGPVAANLATSSSVRRVAERFGCRYIRTAVGEINVTEAMVAAGAVVGGEGNGGVIVPAVQPSRDSYVGMAIVLELLAQTGKSVAQLCDAIPRYCIGKDKIVVRSDRAPQILQALRRKYADRKVTLIDGLHVDLDEDRRFLIRASNTEPVIRIVTEAPDEEEAAELLAALKCEILEFTGGGESA